MSAPTVQLDKKALLKFMRAENEHIKDLLLTFNIPDSIEDCNYDDYLLHNAKTVRKHAAAATTHSNASVDELQDRLNMIKNKMKAKKRPTSERAQKKREAKKLKKNKEFQKVLVTAAKSVKNENQKLAKAATTSMLEHSKQSMQPLTEKSIFNEEAKIVFSKFDFATHPGAKVKQSHQNPREILKKIKETDKKINELKEQGETEKAAELKNEIAWKKAFDKVAGKKVKDDPQLLYKAIKKRKVEKKKSKKEWTERKQKVESGIEQRQKKRQDNINKRIKDKTNKKLKKLSKKGRVIPGF